MRAPFPTLFGRFNPRPSSLTGEPKPFGLLRGEKRTFQSAPVIADGRTPLTHRTLLPNDFFRLFREPVAENHVRIKDTEHPKKKFE